MSQALGSLRGSRLSALWVYSLEKKVQVTHINTGECRRYHRVSVREGERRKGFSKDPAMELKQKGEEGVMQKIWRRRFLRVRNRNPRLEMGMSLV